MLVISMREQLLIATSVTLNPTISLNRLLLLATDPMGIVEEFLACLSERMMKMMKWFWNQTEGWNDWEAILKMLDPIVVKPGDQSRMVYLHWGEATEAEGGNFVESKGRTVLYVGKANGKKGISGRGHHVRASSR